MPASSFDQPGPEPDDAQPDAPVLEHVRPTASAPGAPAEVPPVEVPPAVRAQILATEHWSLLATRSMTWSEIMSRITIHLTVSSAALVVLALTAQATDFGPVFQMLAIGLTSAVLLLGTLTGLRVYNASADDAAMVLGMNRLRAAYLELDPGVERYLVADSHDDQLGLMATFTLGRPRSTLSHVIASTSLFMATVNTLVAGTLGALVSGAAGLDPWAVAVTGTATGLAYLGVTVDLARRYFSKTHVEPRFPTRH